ncbi:GGDEF domain-containing protein [Vibrio algarum]|uniref:GGDEF domain-containing protein n=1 Tax=Vibrio algarum TaxID=3020714 RepID=A0ABT4YTN8_9VIBR|nr:GGDEF domain-containing protein [Vibrio sp. KJ40-1]MDB1124932.1 GGDEF domain-containing protein [Vibrio sp. KJ40-1]
MEISPDLFARSSMYSQIIWPAFCSIIGVFTLLSYTEEVQDKLALESHTDQLTGIHNRRMFDNQLKHTIETLSQTKSIGTLIYLDLDGFKPINDRYGHYVGDKVLVELSARLKKMCCSGQIVARLGGDEFAIIIYDLGSQIDEAQNKANDIAQNIQQLIKEPIHTHGLILQVDCSIGVHMLLPTSPGAHVALREADNAMYLSKNTKRGSISFSNTAPKTNYNIAKIGITEIDEEHQLLDDLLQSLRDGNYDFSAVKALVEERIKQHFNNEVEVSNKLGLNMTEEHIQHHIEVMSTIGELSDVSDKDSAHEYLTSIHKTLEDHALKFDCSLIETS